MIKENISLISRLSVPILFGTFVGVYLYLRNMYSMREFERIMGTYL